MTACKIAGRVSLPRSDTAFFFKTSRSHPLNWSGKRYMKNREWLSI